MNEINSATREPQLFNRRQALIGMAVSPIAVPGALHVISELNCEEQLAKQGDFRPIQPGGIPFMNSMTRTIKIFHPLELIHQLTPSQWS